MLINIVQNPFTDDKASGIVLYVYNDDVVRNILGSAIQLSVIGLYVTIVYTIGKFVRIFFDRISQRVIYEEMPNTDALFELCDGTST